MPNLVNSITKYSSDNFLWCFIVIKSFASVLCQFHKSSGLRKDTSEFNVTDACAVLQTLFADELSVFEEFP